MRKSVKVLLVIAACIVGLLLLLMLAGSPVVKYVAERHSEEWIGRRVEIGSVLVNPFAGSVRIRNLHCTDADTVGEFMRFDELYAQISLVRLIGRHVYLRHIHLTGFDVNLWSNDTCFNFSDLPQRFCSADTAAVQDTTPSSWRVSLNDIRLRGGHLAYADRKRERDWALENVNLVVPGLSFGRGQTDAGLSLDLPDNGGNLRLRGAYNMQSNAYSLILDLRAIDVAQALPLVQDYVNVRSLNALLDGHVLAHGSLDDIRNVSLQGSLSLDGLEIKDDERQPVLTMNSMAVRVEDINLKTMTMRFDTVLLDSLHVNFLRRKDGTTLSRLLGKETEETTEVETPADRELREVADGSDSVVAPVITPAPKLKLFVRTFRMDHSSVHYTDRTLFSRFEYDVTALSARADNLTLNGDNHIMLRGNLPGGGSMMANWRGATDFEHGNSRIVMMLKNVQLKDLSPWVEYMFANPVKGGTLSLNSDNTIRHGVIDAMEKIDLYDLKLGRKNNRLEAEMKGVPLKTAVDLLKDMNGKITLEVPVTGDMRSPRFSLGKVIGRAIGNVLLKATAVPFVAMANAQNIRVDDLTQMPLDLLLPDFTLEQYAKLDLIAQMMKEREDLQLTMTQRFNLQQAVEERAVFNLKKTFYQQQQGDALIGNLTLMDMEKIRAIKDNNGEFNAWVKALVGTKGSLPTRAVAYYGTDSLETEVLRYAEMHNRFLVRYLSKNQGIKEKRITAQTAPRDELAAYKGRSLYTIGAALPEE